MYHNEEDDKICEINQINRDNKARNNACWKCGEVGHFSRECPLNETKDTNTQDRYAGKIQHTYTGSTPVTKKMWQDLMKKAINATASSMVLANKYKQMEKQSATNSSSHIRYYDSHNKYCQDNSKQYTTIPKTTITSSPQTSVMKPVGTSTSQNQNKNQNNRIKLSGLDSLAQ